MQTSLGLEAKRRDQKWQFGAECKLSGAQGGGQGAAIGDQRALVTPSKSTLE